MTNHEAYIHPPLEDRGQLGRVGLLAYPDGNTLSGERIEMAEYVSEKVVDGLGFGEGTISRVVIEADAGAEAVRKVDELIASPEILVDVDKDDNGNLLDDDGCGDGRMAGLIKKGRETLKGFINSHRAKVFGGGSTMATAAMIGSGEASGPLAGVFKHAMGVLTRKKIGFGAHEDSHAHGPKCGCGAIDKAPEAATAVSTYGSEISGVFDVLGLERSHLDGSDGILNHFGKYAASLAGQEYRGSDVMDEIAANGKIIKRLDGEHLETRIILNLVRGKTVNQRLVHEVSGGKIDVFAVDVWRMQDLAVRLYPDDENAQQRAFQSMVAYTLGVAAVLTKGDQPVYVVKPVEQLAAAQA